MTSRHTKTVLLLLFIFFNLFSNAQWTASWLCLNSGAPNSNAPFAYQTIAGQTGAHVDATGNGCDFLFTAITGTTAICVPDSFTVTATMQNNS